MLLCMLAAVVISTAVIALVQLHRRSRVKIESRRSVVKATSETDGLYQRVITVIRNDPTYGGTVTPATKSAAGCYAVVKPVAASQTDISIYAYATAKAPLLARQVDPTAL